MDFARARIFMVDGQLRPNQVQDPRILSAFGDLPREAFLPADLAPRAHADADVPLPGGRVLMQPMVMARLFQLAELRRGDRTLLLGAGCGYGAAVLAAMGYKVHTIERQKELFEFSKRLLGELHAQGVQRFGDGYKGMPAFAPFDGILVTAAAPEIPPALLAQLAVGGKLILPVGPEGEDQRMWRITRQSDKDFDREDLGTFRFVPMLGNVENQ
jgi:protein-L-isoaspartate(D-aspartate) O-methyltransferase